MKDLSGNYRKCCISTMKMTVSGSRIMGGPNHIEAWKELNGSDLVQDLILAIGHGHIYQPIARFGYDTMQSQQELLEAVQL